MNTIFLEPRFLSLNHPLISPLVISSRIQSPSIFEFEHLFFNKRGLIILWALSICLLEIKMPQTIFLVTKKFLSVKEFLKSFIFSVLLEIGFKVIPIPLFLLGKVTRINSIGIVPSLAGPLKHSSFPPCMIDWINIFSGFILENLPETSIKFLNNSLSFHQILICPLGDGLPIWTGSNFIIFIIFHSHHIDAGFKFTFRLFLDSVGRICQNSIMIIHPNKRINRIFRLLEQRVLKVSISLAQGQIVGGIVLAHIFPP